ncbi:MAG TPA: hypothetical protein VGD59_00665 [Acidisarcina sp.]
MNGESLPNGDPVLQTHPLPAGTPPPFRVLAAKTMIAHTLTYVVMGVLASRFLNYAALFGRPCSGMRPMNSIWVMIGPLLQPIRGLLFASVFYPLRSRLFGVKDGWLMMSWILVAIGILSTFSPATGSFEGLVYSTVPASIQLRGWLEIMPQAVLLSALLCYWINHPGKRWLTWVLSILFALTTGIISLGLFARNK